MLFSYRNYFFLFISFLLCNQFATAWAYNDEMVHPIINESSVRQSNLNTMLQQLKFPDGIDTYFNEKRVWQWFRIGGYNEDFPDSRSFNHFHDPLESWENAGLLFAHSALVWSQRGSTEYPYPNHFSWQAARGYFYSALTTGQESEYARTFQSIGQVMHLISDMAVPAHVRNDMHPPPFWSDPYEVWTASNDGLKVLDSINAFSGLHVDQTIFNNYVSNDSAPLPISALWDQNNYNRPTPDPSVTKGAIPNLAGIGLAEYTNANFFSKDTVFSAEYPHPALADTNADSIDWSNPEAVDAEDGVIDYRVYIYGNAGGTQDIRLASVGYLSYNFIQAGYSELSSPVVNDIKVHEDYASQLIPRAVGYSTALIDYFFRGTLEISPPNQYLYGIVDDAAFFDASGNRTGEQYFDSIKAKVRNTSTLGTDETGQPIVEDVGAGSLVAVAKYKRRTDFLPDLSNEPPIASSMEENFSYSVSAPYPITYLSSVSPMEIPFNFSADPIPVGITDLYLNVVFNGDLGAEQDNAVAVGMMDLNEPMFFRLTNSTDKVYFFNQVLDPSDLAPGTISPGEINQTITGSLGFYPPPPVGAFGEYSIDFTLPPSSHSNIIFLSSGESFSVRVQASTYLQPLDYVYTSVRSQDAPPYQSALPFRGTFAHQGHGFFSYFPDMTGIWDAPWPDLQNMQPVAASIAP